MSVQAITFVLGLHTAGEWRLKPHPSRLAERCVMFSLANHANDRFECHPGVPTIAGEAGLRDADAAREVLRRLEDKGWIETVIHGAPDRRIRADRRTNLYRILLDDREGAHHFYPDRDDPRSQGGSCDHDPRSHRITTPGGAGGEPSFEPSTTSSSRSPQPDDRPIDATPKKKSTPTAAAGAPENPSSPTWPDAYLETLDEVLELRAQHGLPENPPTPSVPASIIRALAYRLLELRNREVTDGGVPREKAWRKRARKNLREDDQLPSATRAVRHPALGCIGRPDEHERQLDALAHVHRTGAWPDRPAPRRRIAIVDGVSTDVDTLAEPSAPMTSSYRAVRDALKGAQA